MFCSAFERGLKVKETEALAGTKWVAQLDWWVSSISNNYCKKARPHNPNDIPKTHADSGKDYSIPPNCRRSGASPGFAFVIPSFVSGQQQLAAVTKSSPKHHVPSLNLCHSWRQD